MNQMSSVPTHEERPSAEEPKKSSGPKKKCQCKRWGVDPKTGKRICLEWEQVG